jgi:signal transduction histidine kinase/DNA-binding response OmpR family regulator
MTNRQDCRSQVEVAMKTPITAYGKPSTDQADFRFLVENNADGIIVVDDNGAVLFANPAAEHIFGRSSEALVGSPIGVPVVAGETTEIDIHRPGGEKIDAEIRVVETTWDHRPALLASLRDVSARRAMEERFRHAAKMEAIGRLTAGIAHDFNNLLTVIIGNLETAQRHSERDNPRLVRALANAMRGARRAAVVTERLLAFARRKPLEPRPLNANDLISGMSDLLWGTLGEAIDVRTSLVADLWWTEVDPTELEGAILNLAVNARDAMPSGGRLVIETANVELDAAYAAANAETEAGSYVLISVADTGVGMSREVLSQVFEPFFTTKGGGQGTGLGLSQVYGFVRQSRGHIKIYSEESIGTTVKIYLPRFVGADAAARSQATDLLPETREISSSLSGETILVVEDDDDVRNYAATSLRELGCRVLEAIDGPSALETIGREGDLRLLFTDLGLPGGINGLALAERALKLRPRLKVLLTTAYAGSALVHDGRLDPKVELLTKPFTLTALAGKIQAILGGNVEPRILVVEDEPLVRMMLVDALTEAGCRIEEAGTAREGCEKLRATGEGIDAAVIDLGLPDGGGEAFVAALRAIRSDLPVVVATGYADSGLRERLARDDQLRIVTKPFDPAQLMSTLRTLGISLHD